MCCPFAIPIANAREANSSVSVTMEQGNDATMDSEGNKSELIIDSESPSQPSADVGAVILKV